MKAKVGRWQKVLIIIQALKFGDGDRPDLCRENKVDVSSTFFENIFRSIRYNKYEKFIKSHENKHKQNHFFVKNGYSDEKIKQTQIMKCINDNVKNLTN